MQVPSIVRPSFIALPPLHQWPRSVKRVMFTIATILCISIYILLIAGVISFFAILFDVVVLTF